MVFYYKVSHMLCSNVALSKKNPKKQKKHLKDMIGRLGGHAPSGENHWVEGAEGRAGQAGEA